MFDPEEFINKTKSQIRNTFDTTSDGYTLTTAMLACRAEDPAREFDVTMISMPDLTDGMQRITIMRAEVEYGAFFMALYSEVWSAEVQPDDQIGQEYLKRAFEADSLSILPAKYRKENMRLYAEGPEHPIRSFRAVITHDESTKLRVLDPVWEELQTKLPRPEFRRYFVETKPDGTKKITIPSLTQNIFGPKP